MTLARSLSFALLLVLPLASAEARAMGVGLRSAGACASGELAAFGRPGPRVRPAVADSAMLSLFQSGQAFPDFLAAAKARREGWHRIADSAVIADALIARARAVGGTWHMLVIAIDSCGDSMNSVPYVAKLASQVPGLDLRIVLPAEGKAVQERFRTLDGRPTTPTYVLLDAEGRERGCITELPKGIRRWAHDARGAKVASDSIRAGISAFYAADRGVSIVTETIELMEAARDGRMVCERGE